MTSENVATDQVTLHYTLTSDDLLDGFGAQHRTFRQPWYLRWPITIVTPLTIAVVLGRHALTGDLSIPVTLAVLGVLLAVMMPLAVGADFLLRRFLANPRVIYRWQVRLIVRANPALTQPMVATISDTGVRITSTGTGEITTGWSLYPVYVETDRSFVLLASRRRGAAVLVLPKRGLAGADPGPLRALLGTYSRRIETGQAVSR